MAKIDWAFTEDGDLVVGDPKVTQTGEILYKHLDGTEDTEMREDGQEIRDIGLTYDLEANKQTIMNRLKTDTPDWYHHPAMGGNLSDLIGEPNTRETGERGAYYIRKALTYGNLYSDSQISVRPIPVGANEIAFVVDITMLGNQVTRLPLVFNLEHGVVSIYEIPKTSQEGV